MLTISVKRFSHPMIAISIAKVRVNYVLKREGRRKASSLPSSRNCVSFSKYGSDLICRMESRTMDLRKKESGILFLFVLVINSVRNTYFVKIIFFQLFSFMDTILRLHMYPENMYSVPSLKMQKIRIPSKLITMKGKKKLKKKRKNNQILTHGGLPSIGYFNFLIHFQLNKASRAPVIMFLENARHPKRPVSTTGMVIHLFILSSPVQIYAFCWGDLTERRALTDELTTYEQDDVSVDICN